MPSIFVCSPPTHSSLSSEEEFIIIEMVHDWTGFLWMILFHQMQDLMLWGLSVLSSSWKSLEAFLLFIQYPNYLKLDALQFCRERKIGNNSTGHLHIIGYYSGLNCFWS